MDGGRLWRITEDRHEGLFDRPAGAGVGRGRRRDRHRRGGRGVRGECGLGAAAEAAPPGDRPDRPADARPVRPRAGVGRPGRPPPPTGPGPDGRRVPRPGRGRRGDPDRLAGPAAARVHVQKKSVRAAEQDRPDVAARRAAWRAEVAPRLDPDRLVFVDETWAKTNMTRTHGYAPKGERLVAAAPHGHWHTTTFVGALRSDGMIAPLVIDGAINGDLFRADVGRVLVPELRPGDAVVLDNLGGHTTAGVRGA